MAAHTEARERETVDDDQPPSRAPPDPPDEESGEVCEAVFDHEGRTEDELSFRAGDTFVILQQSSDGWWTGELNGLTGVFPHNYVRLKSASPRTQGPTGVPALQLATVTAAALAVTDDDDAVLPQADSTDNNDSNDSKDSKDSKESKGSKTPRDREGEKEGESAGGAMVLKSGYLSKKGHKRRNWTVRWFVLQPARLLYFSNPNDSKAKGEIGLSDDSTVHVVPHMKREHCFQITTAERPFVYYISAQSKEELDTWLRALRIAKQM